MQINVSISFIDALISLIDQNTLKFFYQKSIKSKILQQLSVTTVQVHVAVGSGETIRNSLQTIMQYYTSQLKIEYSILIIHTRHGALCFCYLIDRHYLRPFVYLFQDQYYKRK